jgi:hypothetical protein
MFGTAHGGCDEDFEKDSQPLHANAAFSIRKETRTLLTFSKPLEYMRSLCGLFVHTKHFVCVGSVRYRLIRSFSTSERHEESYVHVVRVTSGVQPYSFYVCI